MREKVMKNTASFILISLLLASIFAGAASGADVGEGGAEEEVDNITIKAAEGIINSQNVVVLDVRAQAAYESGHIAGSKLMPIPELEDRIDGLDKGKTIIVYCGNGGRSEKAREVLVQHGFKNVYNMLGGITAWIDAGLPTTSFANTQTPIMPNNNSLSSEINGVPDDNSVFLFFYTDWCHFCQQQLPIIDELEMEYAGKTAFIRINVNERPDYAEEFGVSALPTMFFISDKNEAGYAKQEISGFTEKTRLKEIIDLEIEQSEQTVICDIAESGIPEDADYNSSIDEGKANSNVLSSLSSDVANEGNYKLLIIAPDEFINELKLLKDFKDATGRPTLLLSLSKIYNNPSYTGDAPEKIKKCIAHYEKSTGIEYVMLVGDCDKFPVRFVCIHTPEKKDYTRHFEPADLYYADLFGPDGNFDDWDLDNDGLYAERNYYKNGEMNLDKVNFYPEVAVGRIPASNLTEVTNYIKKVIRYELAPYQPNWFKRAILAVDGGNKPHGDEDKKDSMTIPYLSGFAITKLYMDNPPYNQMSQSERSAVLNSELNKGAGFVNYYGHGSIVFWEWYHKAHFKGLTNNDKLPIVIAISCETAQYVGTPPYQAYVGVDGSSYNAWEPKCAPSSQRTCTVEPNPIQSPEDDSMAEHFLVKYDTGGIGYVGFTSTSNPVYNEEFDELFFKAYGDYGYQTLGEIWQSMIGQYVNKYFSPFGGIKDLPKDEDDENYHYNAMLNMLIRTHLFGDPSLRVGGLYDKKMTITHDTTLYPMTYNAAEGITINASNVVLDCNGAIINGTGWGIGIHIPNGINNVTIKNCKIKNYQYGIDVGSNSNMIISNNIYSNEYGVYLLNGVNNKIISNDIYSNDYGISLINADSNEIRYNTIKNNDEDGIYLDMYSSDNNLISNTICSNTVKDISNNVNYGGPNYGDENTCSNIYKWNDDGTIGCTKLCEHTPTLYYCDSCSDCTNKINTAPPGSVIKLTKNIINHHGTCIEWKGDSKTFDCQNHAIDGNDSTGDHIEGIYYTGIDMLYGSESNTIKNCVISDFEYGIRMQREFSNASYYNNIINNTLYSNTIDGIKIDSSVETSGDFSIIKDNMIINNGVYGIRIFHSNKNLIDSNIVCSNNKSDFFLSDSYDNSGINNYCDTPDGWNDAGETGCSKSCSKAPVSCAPGEVYPYDDMEITSDTKLCRGFYNIPDSDDQGVIIIKSDNVVLDCNGATINGDGSGIGIYNNGFDDVILKNCNIKNYEFGIGTVHSSYNTITSNNISSNSYGIDMEYSSNNTLNSNNIHSNSLYGIYMVYSSYNALNNNKIKNNGYGVSLTDSNNVELNANIICENTISDLYLDNSHDNSGNNNYCDTPDGWNDTGTTGCTNPCAAAPICAPDEVIPYDDLVVTKDTKLCHGFYNISDLGGWGVIYVKRGGNVVLDCNGATLNGTGFGRGIYAGDVRSVTVKNCNIQNYDIGIDTHSVYSTITNNNLNSNDNGLVLWQANGNTITKNHINSNAVHGIDLHGNSDLNTIGNNVIENNGKGVWFASDSNENNLSFNIICSNSIDIKDDDENFGDENTCDRPDGWDDTGTTGCTYACPKCITPTDDLYINSDTTLCPGFYNIPDSGAEGVIIINASNVVLDCNGATLNGTGSGIGIFNPGFENVTLKNGNVLNYGIGIHLSESDNSIISNTNVSQSSNQGISIESSHYCDVYGNRVSFSGDRGITFGGGGNNAVYDNTVYNNSAYGAIEAIYSDNNEIYNNTAYFNSWGIATNHGSNNLIYENTIFRNQVGVYLDWPSTDNRVFNNNISSNNEGIWTNHNSTDNIIAGNTIFSNEYVGIRIETDNNTITNNTANNNRIIGLYLCANLTGNTVTGNSFCNNLMYDVQNEGSNSGDENTCDLTDNWNDAGTIGCTYPCVKCVTPKDDLYINSDTTLCPGVYNIPDSGAEGVIIINASNVVLDCNGAIINGTMTGSDYGIYSRDYDNVTIKNCNVMNYQHGIELEMSSDSTITHNNLSFNRYGIYLFYSDDSMVTNNNANSNKYKGIGLASSSNNLVTNNNANANGDGIFLGSFSQNNKIAGNNASSNKQAGIYIYGDSSSNKFSNNRMNNNLYGIYLGSCICPTCSHYCPGGNFNNTIKVNEILNNEIGIFSNQSNSMIDLNIVCDNIESDFNSSNWFSSSGDNNTCDKPNGWNDAGTTGCTYTCPIEKQDLKISDLKGPDWSNYVGKEVTVEGIFVRDPLPMLVTDLDIVRVNMPMPDDQYILLIGNDAEEIDPRSSGGAKLRLKGLVAEIDDSSKYGDEYVAIETISYEMLERLEEYAPEIIYIETYPELRLPHRYAILFSGGSKPADNHIRYWNDLKFMYSTLVNEYGYTDKTIAVLYADGKAPVDPKTGQIDKQMPVHYSATQTNLQTVFNLLRESANEEDFIFVFTTNHGGGFCKAGYKIWGKTYYDLGGQLDTNGDEPAADVLWEADCKMDLNGDGFKTGQVSWDEELCSWGGSIFDDAFPNMLANLKYDRMVILMEQCFSGGLIADMAGSNRIIMSAAGEYEPSWAMGPYPYDTYDEFSYYFTCAINGADPKGKTVNADANGDGEVSLVEAFNYARAKDTQSETPWYEDNGDGVPHSGKMPAGGDGTLGSNTSLE